MVALTREQVLRQANYFGKRGVKGSNRKRIVVDNMGVHSPKEKMTTFGTSSDAGMAVMTGGSILSKIKALASPLLKRGSKVLAQIAKAGLSSQADRIKNPGLKALAQQGLETGEELVNQALKGNTNLSSVQKTLKQGMQEGLPKVLSAAMKGKKGGRAMPDTVAGVTDRKLKPSTKNTTTDNRQLTLLKDIVRSKPIKTRVNRQYGAGFSYT